MSYRYRKSMSSFSRVHRPDEDLIADTYTLIEKRLLEMNNKPANRLQACREMLAFTATEAYSWRSRLKGELFLHGPLTLDVARIGAVYDEKLDDLVYPYDGVLEVHFTGDRRNLRNIRKNLASAANSLIKHRPSLPDVMSGVSHIDIVRPASRVLGAEVVRLPEYIEDSIYKDIVILEANIAREVYGRPPLVDTGLYQFTVSTDDFIERFSPR